MKSNKSTAMACFMLSALALFGVIFIPSECCATLHNICLSLFTGFIISLTIAFVGYFHEKEKIVTGIDSALTTLYINLSYMKIATGIALEKIAITQKSDYSNWKIGDISGFSDINIDCINDVKLDMYTPFIKAEEYKIINDLVVYKNKMFNLKHLLSGLHHNSLDYEIRSRELNLAVQNGQVVNQWDVDEMQNRHNTLIAKTSRIHEYQVSLLMELENLSDRYIRHFSKKDSWEKRKKAMDISVSKIVDDSILKL